MPGVFLRRTPPPPAWAEAGLGFAFWVWAVLGTVGGVCFRRIVCECGYLREQHMEDAAKLPIFLGKEWDPSRHIQEMPTDAFGDIHFTGLGQKMGKVIRFSHLWRTGSQCSGLAVADEMWVFPS